jgi:hypothetical protein
MIIDQSRINAPDFPRSQEWWRRFVPEWVTVTVRDDGTVTLEPSSLVMRYTAERGTWWEPGDLKAAALRHRAKSLAQWVGGLPRLSVAIVEETGQ